MNILSTLKVSVPRLLGIALAVFAAGCASKPTGWPQAQADRAERIHHGYIYYLDGAGGGTAKENYATAGQARCSRGKLERD